ncbi:hypothetical protein [Metabacillus iocasae]|uniref:Uncharacterized protein YxeA n=1 Tax=Priestia iocasae TaxID=2291674 RepID=A0ABS2QVP9_9BACI|nr:hypothetical protein [Metabacillus iocasae]MBM7703475.1 uncharacterized protein YxeA [Metabacillus iocasae]
MNKIIVMWGLSAVLFLAAVIGVYTFYEKMNGNESHHAHEVASQKESEVDHQHGKDEHEDHSAHSDSAKSEVTTNVTYENAIITIEVKDKEGDTPELALSHEKMMHLIIVSSDLNHYYHVHPERHANGLYTKEFHLPNGAYKVFVDIKPKNIAYHVSPVELHIGDEQHHHESNQLTPDQELKKTVDGKEVELTTTPLQAGEPVTLTFDTKEATPEPYLGALGHVVILDETGEKFLHVHPTSKDQTVFETTFAEPGLYKVWGEFQFDGNVHVYPFVIEVK